MVSQNDWYRKKHFFKALTSIDVKCPQSWKGAHWIYALNKYYFMVPIILRHPVYYI